MADRPDPLPDIDVASLHTRIVDDHNLQAALYRVAAAGCQLLSNCARERHPHRSGAGHHGELDVRGCRRCRSPSTTPTTGRASPQPVRNASSLSMTSARISVGSSSVTKRWRRVSRRRCRCRCSSAVTSKMASTSTAPNPARSARTTNASPPPSPPRHQSSSPTPTPTGRRSTPPKTSPSRWPAGPSSSKPKGCSSPSTATATTKRSPSCDDARSTPTESCATSPSTSSPKLVESHNRDRRHHRPR